MKFLNQADFYADVGRTKGLFICQNPELDFLSRMGEENKEG